jgi:hypothetical protein
MGERDAESHGITRRRRWVDTCPRRCRWFPRISWRWLRVLVSISVSIPHTEPKTPLARWSLHRCATRRTFPPSRSEKPHVSTYRAIRSCLFPQHSILATMDEKLSRKPPRLPARHANPQALPPEASPPRVGVVKARHVRPHLAQVGRFAQVVQEAQIWFEKLPIHLPQKRHQQPGVRIQTLAENPPPCSFYLAIERQKKYQAQGTET